MTTEELERLAEAAAEAVRQASREASLMAWEDVLAALEAGGFLDAGEGAGAPEALPVSEVRAVLPALLAEHPDLESLEGLDGRTLYHDPALLSRTYARILDRKGSPVPLMAEEIRANSRDYPRPVPLELFEAPPFDLAPEDIESALRAMAASPEHRDITYTTTPGGGVFLFSTLHLERGYAAFLALQKELQALNP